MQRGIRSTPRSRCYLCNQTGAHLFRGLRDRHGSVPGEWGLRRCPLKTCGLVWLDPMPDADDLARFHAERGLDESPISLGRAHTSADARPAPPAESRLAQRFRRGVRQGVLQAGYGYGRAETHGAWEWLGRGVGVLAAVSRAVRIRIGAEALWLPAQVAGRVLDVGCAHGAALVRLRRLGWTVAGVEPDSAAVRHAREHGRLDVHHGHLEDARLPAASADAVTLEHVLQHVPDPIRLVREAGRVLRPGGKLVLITPNTRSLGRRRFGTHWTAWDPPRHLFLFSPQTLATVVREAGLEVEHALTTGRRARRTWSEDADGGPDGRTGMVALAAVRRRWLRIEGRAAQWLENLIAPRGEAGEEVVVIATRR